MGAEIKVAVAGESGGVRVSVSDKGPEYSREELGCLFEPFYHADMVDRGDGSGGGGERKSMGSGVALALASRLVTAHGGAIEVKNNDGCAEDNEGGSDSEDAGGVTITFTLPGTPPAV